MSENPVMARYIAQMEEEFDQAFIMAKRVMKRHEPEKFDSEKDSGGYWSSLPLIALDIVNRIGNAGAFHHKCPDREKDEVVAASDTVLHEIKALNKKAGMK